MAEGELGHADRAAVLDGERAAAGIAERQIGAAAQGGAAARDGDAAGAAGDGRTADVDGGGGADRAAVLDVERAVADVADEQV